MAVTTLTESRSYGRDLEYARDQHLPGIIEMAIDAQPVVSIFTGKLANAMFAERGPNGAGKRVFEGGASIEQKLRLGVNATMQDLASAYSSFDLTPQDNVRHLRFNWKLYGGSVNVSDHEVNMASGQMAKDNIIESEMRDGANSLADKLGDHFYSNGGVTSRVTDLASLISANDSVGGLSGATYGNWNSRGVSARGTTAGSVSFAGGSFASTGLSNWRIAFNNASDGTNMVPDVLLTTYAIEEFYEGKIQAQERFTPGGLADAGFSFLQFKKAAVIPDAKCTSGVTFFLNIGQGTIFLAVLGGADFGSTPFQMPDAQRVRISKLFVTAELVCLDRKRNNKLTGQTA